MLQLHKSLLFEEHLPDPLANDIDVGGCSVSGVAAVIVTGGGGTKSGAPGRSGDTI